MFGKIERKYEFRERLSRSHERNRRDFDAKKLDNEIEITSKWRIVCAANADERIVLAGKDLADYFETSLSVPVVFERLAEPEKADCAIILQTDAAMGKNRSFAINVEADRIVITGGNTNGRSGNTSLIKVEEM